MPFQIGSVATHDDGQHTGSAKRDAISGVAGLNGLGDSLALGPVAWLTRNGTSEIWLGERISGDGVAYWKRIAAFSFEAYILESSVSKRIQTESMKNIASGIAGLDASTLLALAQQRLNFKLGSFTRDTSIASGNQSISGVGFVPRLVIFLAAVNSQTGEMSIGWSDGTLVQNVADNHNLVANTFFAGTNAAINMQGTAGVAAYVTAVGMDADGFTLSWLKAGAKAGTATIHYLAIR
jgi:hypothetical protein